MRTSIWVLLGVFVAGAMVVVGLTAGWALWGRDLWAVAPSYASEAGLSPRGCVWEQGADQNPTGRWTMHGASCRSDPDRSGKYNPLTINDAHAAIEQYLRSRGQEELEIVEVMEFQFNLYAIVREPDTGIGAMELLVDKYTGVVGPEMGPNMMWNTRYGMHRRGGMMGRPHRTNVISEEEALIIAQRWLDSSRPGATVEKHADPFYGYYTVHTLENGAIEGMLSVHSVTGQVWYHNWHGAFVQMIEAEDYH